MRIQVYYKVSEVCFGDSNAEKEIPNSYTDPCGFGMADKCVDLRDVFVTPYREGVKWNSVPEKFIQTMEGWK